MASDSSAKAGSKVLSGNDASPETLFRAESLKEDRDEGRRGVVGREVRDRELDRFALESRRGLSFEDIVCFVSSAQVLHYPYLLNSGRMLASIY